MKTEIEVLLGIQITDWDTAFQKLEESGGFDAIKVHKLLVFLIKRIEKLENASPVLSDAPKTPLKLDKIPVYNPDTEDFKCVMRDEKTNKQMEPFIVPAQDIAYFEPKVAEHIKNQLAGYLLSKRGAKTNAEDDLKAIKEEVTPKNE